MRQSRHESTFFLTEIDCSGATSANKKMLKRRVDLMILISAHLSSSDFLSVGKRDSLSSFFHLDLFSPVHDEYARCCRAKYPDVEGQEAHQEP
jgi:hypothetical protein